MILMTLLVATDVVSAADPTREELAIKPTGPVMISPWRAAAEPKTSDHWNHYCYSAPVGFYSCGWGYGYGWYGPYRAYWLAPPCP